jgi:succinylarginine dihydrolase
MASVEANFDGLIGPSHHYAGQSHGNIASSSNALQVARPRAAALEGIGKMRAMVQRGLVQGVLPPQERPFIPALRALGFFGKDGAVLAAAHKADPRLVRIVSSASSMWAANAATVSPSPDTGDGRLHLSTANLLTMPHRVLEAEGTFRALGRAFSDNQRFAVHAALPAHPLFADEGAANHMRMCRQHGEAGVEIYVTGRSGFSATSTSFPARQTREASEAVVRRHGLKRDRTVFIAQSIEAIDAGAFHNDVVAVSHEHVLFYHEQAFEDADEARAAIRLAAKGLFEPAFVEVPANRVSLEDAVSSYLFNAMLVRFPGQERATLIAPAESREHARVGPYLAELIAGNGPIGDVLYVDVRQSMRNGGGPACLRLRVVLSDTELQAVRPAALMNEEKLVALENWVMQHYREELSPTDLIDPALIDEVRRGLDHLTQILDLGSDFYDFQRL